MEATQVKPPITLTLTYEEAQILKRHVQNKQSEGDEDLKVADFRFSLFEALTKAGVDAF